jgi:DNA-binding PadR family transcriptional regulator
MSAPHGPDAHLPLTALDLSVLLVLTEEASWGYGIVKAVSDRSRGRLELAPGNVYQALDRLIARGWIRSLAQEELPDEADPRRRYYAITPAGVSAAAAEARRLKDMMPSLERVLHPRPSEG